MYSQFFRPRESLKKTTTTEFDYFNTSEEIAHLCTSRGQPVDILGW